MSIRLHSVATQMSDFNQKRSIVMQALVMFVGIVLIIRLLFLQVFGVGGYKEASKKSSRKTKNNSAI